MPIIISIRSYMGLGILPPYTGKQKNARVSLSSDTFMLGVVISCMGASPISLLMISATDLVPPQGLK